MKNRTFRFLIVSIICIAVICVLDFSYLTLRMNRRGAEAIEELGSIYMKGMSEQAAAHFGTTIELRLSQVGALVDSVPPGNSKNIDSARVALSYSARARGLDHLALCTGDGGFDMLYGSQMKAANAESFVQSLTDGEATMTVGSDEQGNDLVLMGIPADYPMDGGRESIALVAALPVSYISDTLSLDSDDNMIYYFIIDRDGDFIIRDSDVTDSTYFERVRTQYESVGEMSGEQYLAELAEAMAAGAEYTTEFTIGGERRFLYATSLPYSEWYLLLFVPYGRLDQIVNSLGRSWGVSSLLSCLLILVVLFIVFAWYFRLMGKHVRDAEEARMIAEHANRAKSEFLSNMSHDIRTPMNGIVGMTAIASANLDNIEQVRDCLKKIALSSRHLLGLINDILDMSKIESGKLTLHVEKISLQETMQSIVNIVQPQINSKKQRFDVYVYDIPYEQVYCDSIRLNQVLLNLLGNAIKFTPEGGSICAACYEEDSQKGADWVKVHIRVKDTGIGMTKEFMGRIFDAFSREDSGRVQKTEGSGLGMAITKYIVDAMQGTIEVESELNKGTEFHVSFDLEKAPVDEKDMELPPWEILVVDDDELLCESTAATLRSIGCRAEWALDGESAVQMVKERHEKGNDYQIILLDWRLPGIDGIETARKIREFCGEDTALLFISAADWNEMEKRAKEVGIEGMISKPLFRSNLYYGLKSYYGHESSQEAPVEAQAIDLEGKRVILAEDNDLNWEIADELLSELGLTLTRAENGQICVDLFRDSAEGWYDAILMDLRMPVMSGYEATRAIRAMERPDAQTIPIIAMSADAFSEDVQRCLDCGMNAHVAKPIDMDEVSRLLEKYMGSG